MSAEREKSKARRFPVLEEPEPAKLPERPAASLTAHCIEIVALGERCLGLPAWHPSCELAGSKGLCMKWLVLFCLVGKLAFAETNSTAAIGKDVVSLKQMGNAADYLVTEARCRDVTGAFAQAASEESSKRTKMMNIAFVTYAFGYAQGRGLTFSQALAELLARCEASPELPFAGFVD